MDMKEKMPITPTTPVPAPSAAISAQAHEEGPSVTDDLDLVPEPAFAIHVGPEANIEGAAAEGLDAGREPKMSADQVSVFYGDKQALKDISIKIY